MRRSDSGKNKLYMIPLIHLGSLTLALISSLRCSLRRPTRDMMLDFLLLLLGAGVLVAVMALAVLVEVMLIYLMLRP